MICYDCEPNTPDKYEQFLRDSFQGQCKFCESQEGDVVKGHSQVETLELDEVCERFQSVLDTTGNLTTWTKDVMEREVAGL